MVKRISIKDVAKQSGVSIATVSYIVNNTKHVSAETKKRVEKAIEELGYNTNLVARSFKTGKNNLIAFIIPDIANPFFSTLIEEVEAVVASSGYKLIILNTKETIERELDSVKAISTSSLVDGIIIASTSDDYEKLKAVLNPHTPIVFIDRNLPNCPKDKIIVDCFDATCQGVEYLINKGNTKIGYITGLDRISTTAERLKAYETVMKAHDLYDSSLIRIGNSMSHCVNSHLTSLIKAGCTAIVIANNVMATEAMTQMLDEGIVPGRDIDIVGFKDSEQAQYGLQHMSLICQPTKELGKVSGEKILERISNIEKEPTNVVLKASFLPKKD